MATKVHRRRGRMFGRKNSVAIKVIGWVVLIGLCGAAGYGLTLLRHNTPSDPAASTPSETSQTTAPSDPAAATTTAATEPAPARPAALNAAAVALSELREADARATRLDALKQQGCNAVIFDLKSADGVLYYAFTGASAQKARTVDEKALTAEELNALLTDCADREITPIPRLFAFEDSDAPSRLKDARINWSGDRATLWLDAKAANGGKPWLNPYAAAAHTYLLELVSELKAAGVSSLLLDGVRFPPNDYQAYFGTDDQTAETYAQVLTRFVSEVKETLGEDSRLYLAANLTAATGSDTAIYGGNPVTFGADAVCPWVNTAVLESFMTVAADTAEAITTPQQALKHALSVVDTRLSFVEGAKPQIVPLFDAATASLAAELTDGTGRIVTLS